MLSVFKGASASAVGGYFKQADYYTKEGKGSEGVWLGKGAKTLGLFGKTVNADDFTKYLDGQLPGGRPLGKKEGDKRLRTVGWDNTASSPAGVSIAIEVFDDHELEENHVKSVRTLTKFIERESLTVKIWNNEKIVQEPHKSQKGLVAVFKHRTTRNLDPETHSHTFWINAAKGEDNKWRSVDSKKSFFETKMLHGIIFRSEEAYGAKSLGKDICVYIKDGKHYWDLSNVDQGLTKAFSSRSQDIKDFLGPGKHSAAAKAHAAKVTRKVKKTVPLEVLKKVWRKRVTSLGFDFETERQKALSKTEGLQRRSSRVIFNHAISHLSEGNSSFTRNELLHAILSRGLGDIRFPDAKKEIARAVRENRLILRSTGEHASEQVFTTLALKEAEKELVKVELLGRGTRKPIFSRTELNRHLTRSDLNPSQKRSVAHALLSTGSVIGIQGLAGVGKSYTAKRIVEAAESKGLKPIILAPSSSVTSDLSKDMQRQTRTLQSFLKRPEGSRGSIVILDEASMVGTNDMREFLNIAKGRNISRVILMGDKRQLSSAQAGSPFALLQDAGMRTALIDKVIRQEDQKHKEMVQHAYEGNVDKVLNILDKNLNEVGYDEIDQQAVKAWVNSSMRDSIAIVTNTNSRNDRINAAIKNHLKESGEIKGGVDHQTYRSMNVSKADQSIIGNYIHADAVQFHTSYKPLGIRASKIYQIGAVDVDGGRVTLVGPNGKSRIFSPSKSAQKMQSFTLLKASSIEISAGDKIMFTANSYEHKINNKDAFTVSEVNQKSIRLHDVNAGVNKEVNLNDPAMKFVRHAWAGTNHATQGKSVTGVIVAMAANERMTNQSSFYTAISRFKQNIKVFTDDKEQLRHVLNIRDAKPDHALTRAEILKIATDVKQRAIEHEQQKTIVSERNVVKERTQEIVLTR